MLMFTDSGITGQLKKTFQLVLFLFIGSLCAASNLFAEELHETERLKHGIGFSGGYILGTGLTYVHYLGPHMLQASFIGDVDDYKTDFKLGLSYARYIHYVRKPKSLFPVALKFIAGADIRYQDGLVDSDVIVFDDQMLYEEDRSYFYHIGAGLGVDMGNVGKPGLVFSLILTYALSLEEVNNKREWEFSPLPAIGILYSW